MFSCVVLFNPDSSHHLSHYCLVFISPPFTNPADERDWEKLAAYLQIKYEHEAGGSLGIEAVAIDTGGHFTHQAYAFARTYANRRIYAIKGESKQGCPVKGKSSPQDINWRGKIIKAGVKLWHVGTDTAKDLLFGRLKVTQPGPGYVHFSKDLPPEFFHQLTAEHRVLQRTAQGEQHRWVKARARNEVLDCAVYAMFAAHMLDLHRYTERMWAKLEAAVQPAVSDLFSQPARPAAKIPVATAATLIPPEAAKILSDYPQARSNSSRHSDLMQRIQGRHR